MSPEWVSIIALVVVFVVATTMSVNMGVLAFAAALLVGATVGGLSPEEIFEGFPGSIFVVLVGVTYLFAIARANGTTDWLVSAAVRLVRGRLALIPWVMFLVTGALTAIGAVSPAAVAIVAPIGLRLAAKYRIHPLLMGAMVVNGAQAGGFSPISVYGSIVNEVVATNEVPGNALTLFLASLAVNSVVAAVVYVLCGGLRMTRARRTETAELRAPALVGAGGSGAPTVEVDDDPPAEDTADVRLNRERVATLLGLGVLVVTTLVFDLDVGLVALTVAVVLGLLAPGAHRAAVNEVTWPTVLLICGVLTYVGVLEKMGTIDYVGKAVAGVGTPLLAALLICLIGAVVSAFASSVGVLGALIPLAVPLLAAGEIGPLGMIAALAVSATVVDISPFSTNGAIVLANAKDTDRERFFRQLMILGGIVVVAVPVLVWFAFIVPNFG